jgi:hypothetical protein
MQSEIAFVFGVATQAGNIFSDARGMMKSVTCMALAARAIHRSCEHR